MNLKQVAKPLVPCKAVIILISTICFIKKFKKKKKKKIIAQFRITQFFH